MVAADGLKLVKRIVWSFLNEIIPKKLKIKINFLKFCYISSPFLIAHNIVMLPHH